MSKTEKIVFSGEDLIPKDNAKVQLSDPNTKSNFNEMKSDVKEEYNLILDKKNNLSNFLVTIVGLIESVIVIISMVLGILDQGNLAFVFFGVFIIIFGVMLSFTTNLFGRQLSFPFNVFNFWSTIFIGFAFMLSFQVEKLVRLFNPLQIPIWNGTNELLVSNHINYTNTEIIDDIRFRITFLVIPLLFCLLLLLLNVGGIFEALYLNRSYKVATSSAYVLRVIVEYILQLILLCSLVVVIFWIIFDLTNLRRVEYYVLDEKTKDKIPIMCVIYGVFLLLSRLYTFVLYLHYLPNRKQQFIDYTAYPWNTIFMKMLGDVEDELKVDGNILKLVSQIKKKKEFTSVKEILRKKRSFCWKLREKWEKYFYKKPIKEISKHIPSTYLQKLFKNEEKKLVNVELKKILIVEAFFSEMREEKFLNCIGENGKKKLREHIGYKWYHRFEDKLLRIVKAFFIVFFSESFPKSLTCWMYILADVFVRIGILYIIVCVPFCIVGDKYVTFQVYESFKYSCGIVFVLIISYFVGNYLEKRLSKFLFVVSKLFNFKKWKKGFYQKFIIDDSQSVFPAGRLQFYAFFCFVCVIVIVYSSFFLSSPDWKESNVFKSNEMLNLFFLLCLVYLTFPSVIDTFELKESSPFKNHPLFLKYRNDNCWDNVLNLLMMFLNALLFTFLGILFFHSITQILNESYRGLLITVLVIASFTLAIIILINLVSWLYSYVKNVKENESKNISFELFNEREEIRKPSNSYHFFPAFINLALLCITPIFALERINRFCLIVAHLIALFFQIAYLVFFLWNFLIFCIITIFAHIDKEKLEKKKKKESFHPYNYFKFRVLSYVFCLLECACYVIVSVILIIMFWSSGISNNQSLWHLHWITFCPLVLCGIAKLIIWYFLYKVEYNYEITLIKEGAPQKNITKSSLKEDVCKFCNRFCTWIWKLCEVKYLYYIMFSIYLYIMEKYDVFEFELMLNELRELEKERKRKKIKKNKIKFKLMLKDLETL